MKGFDAEIGEGYEAEESGEADQLRVWCEDARFGVDWCADG